MLYNWSTSIALLLRESDELISTALRPAQSSVLLIIFVHCAVDLTNKRNGYTKALTLSNTDKQFLESWEALNENLHVHLPALLTRFKDDESNLSVLVELLDCCDFSSNERALKALMKVVLELVNSTRKENILKKLIASLCSWMQLSGTIAGTVEVAVKGLVNNCLESILDSRAQLQDIVQKQDGDSESSAADAKASKRKSKSVSQVIAFCF